MASSDSYTPEQSPIPSPPSLPQSGTFTFGRLFGGMTRFVYTHNPLYAASASMVFWGLRASFNTAQGTFNANLLAISLAGFILLLALTAYLVIRLGKVWDDARGLLLLIVLMFLGLSVSFDGVLVARPALGAAYCVGGWIFAVAVSEVVLRSIRLRLGPLFRGPYHALLALFFFYPLLVTPLVFNTDGALLQWLLFGFASAGAAIFLTLLPAVRRGAGYVADNGSPWPWPLFPWTLFFILGICVSLRAYYLCLSLHFVDHTDSIFGLYFIAPLLFAAALLLLEGGLASGSAGAIRAAMALPAAAVLLCGIGHRGDHVYRGFLYLFQQTCGGSPLWVALLVAIAFYGFAALRHVRNSLLTLTAAMLLLAKVAPTTFDFDHLTLLRPLPLAVLGAVHLYVGLWRRISWQVLLGNCLVLLALTIGFAGTWFTALHGALPIHLLLASLLATRLWFDDWFSRFALRVAALVALGMIVTVMLAPAGWWGNFDIWIRALHPLLLTGLVAWAAWPLRDRWYASVGCLALAMWSAVMTWRGYVLLRPHLAGLDQLALGLVFFVLAALISMRKAGRLRPRRPISTGPPAVEMGMPEGP